MERDEERRKKKEVRRGGKDLPLTSLTQLPWVIQSFSPGKKMTECIIQTQAGNSFLNI